MSNMLHIVNQSPTERPALNSCLRLANNTDSILLIEDGVYAALKGSILDGQAGLNNGHFKLFVLQPDLLARGLHCDEIIQAIKLVDYSGFVDLVATHRVNQSWL